MAKYRIIANWGLLLS